MPEDTIEDCHFLAEFYSETTAGSSLPSSLRSFFCRKGTDPLIDWGFQFSERDLLPRGYLESVQQRLELLGRINRPELNVPVLLKNESERGFVLRCPASEGELLLNYLARLERAPDGIAIRLMMEVIGFILSLTEAPRILSNVELEDFRVCALDGIQLSVKFCPAFALLREDLALSDYQIARKWTELMARLLRFIKQRGKSAFQGISPLESKAFRGLLKDLEAGRERSLVERIHEIGHLLENELGQGPRGQKRLEFPFSSREMPIGPLADYLRTGFARIDPGNAPSNKNGSTTELCFSPFVVEASSGGDKMDRLGYLLPPDQWFENSLMDAVNRKLSNPFLKSHHNSVRVRSVYCDEQLTVLYGELSRGLPLPSLLRVFDGVSREELLLISGKVHRAMEQFESAGFDLPLVSPWQLELHLEGGPMSGSWEPLLSRGIAEWPPWEVKLRVEPPAESFLDGECGVSWRVVQRRLAGKFFPALVAWMLDWKRFQWSSQSGTLENEALNQDVRIDSLFMAAGKHLDDANPGHREKFFSLLAEGLGDLALE